MKVGNWLSIDFMGAVVARGVHTLVSEVRVDTLREMGKGGDEE